MNLIYAKPKEEKSNFIKIEGESVTDKSGFRPEIATTRDGIIAIENGKGGGYIGLYDSDIKGLTENSNKALAYARGMSRDITEIESAKNFIENAIRSDIENKTEKAIAEKKTENITQTLKNIEKNTTKEQVDNKSST